MIHSVRLILRNQHHSLNGEGLSQREVRVKSRNTCVYVGAHACVDARMHMHTQQSHIIELLYMHTHIHTDTPFSSQGR